MNHENLFGNGTEELSLDDMEKAAGGATQQTHVKVYKTHYVRSGPGTDYHEICLVAQGTVLQYCGVTTEDKRGVYWFGVDIYGSGGIDGYVSSLCSQIC